MIHNLYDTSRNIHQTLTVISVWMILDPAMHQTLSSCCSSLGHQIATALIREGWSRARGHQTVEGALKNRKENSSLWEGATVLTKVRQDAAFAFTSSLTSPSHLSILPSLLKTFNHEIDTSHSLHFFPVHFSKINSTALINSGDTSSSFNIQIRQTKCSHSH